MSERTQVRVSGSESAVAMARSLIEEVVTFTSAVAEGQQCVEPRSAPHAPPRPREASPNKMAPRPPPRAQKVTTVVTEGGYNPRNDVWSALLDPKDRDVQGAPGVAVPAAKDLS